MRIRTGRRRRRVELLAVRRNAAAVRAVSVILHISPDREFHFLLDEIAVAVIGREQQSRDARLLRGQRTAYRAAAVHRNEVCRRARLNRIVYDRVCGIHRVRECRRHRRSCIAHVEHLIREIEDGHVVKACVHMGQVILSRRYIRSHRDRRKIRISIKAGTHGRIRPLIFLHELTERAQRGSIRLNHPVALVRRIKHVVAVGVGRTDKSQVIIAPEYFGHAVRLEEFHADTALIAVRPRIVERVKIILLKGNAAQREVGQQILQFIAGLSVRAVEGRGIGAHAEVSVGDNRIHLVEQLLLPLVQLIAQRDGCLPARRHVAHVQLDHRDIRIGGFARGPGGCLCTGIAVCRGVRIRCI